jgi:hypothetical protein
MGLLGFTSALHRIYPEEVGRIPRFPWAAGERGGILADFLLRTKRRVPAYHGAILKIGGAK